MIIPEFAIGFHTQFAYKTYISRSIVNALGGARELESVRYGRVNLTYWLGIEESIVKSERGATHDEKPTHLGTLSYFSRSIFDSISFIYPRETVRFSFFLQRVLGDPILAFPCEFEERVYRGLRIILAWDASKPDLFVLIDTGDELDSELPAGFLEALHENTSNWMQVSDSASTMDMFLERWPG